MHRQYVTPAFEEKYTYTGTDLGAVWSKEYTYFRVWAPTATAVSVNLYQSGDPECADLLEQIPMAPGKNGTWIARKEGDLHGVYYTYQVCVNGSTVEACDPYACTTGINGHRAMVIDMSSTNPDGWETDTDPNAGKKIADAVIYELHVRDLSAHESSGIRNKGKFLGLTESGTTTPGGVPTGLDHIKSLGVTHLHLLPVYDYGSVDERSYDPDKYNWGYDPVNYNVPEGSYSTDPWHGEVRVREMKQMVKALHDNGISVVMDVVYNHVYHADEFCFNQIVPGYFSRANADGVYSNGSCCGNDTASERSMVSKYIVDSVAYWADEYHIDGFRFDLVGLIDTDTINTIMETVHKAHPNVIFYGEGWDMPTAVTKPGYQMTIQRNSHLVPGFAFFSDTIRDLLRGSIFDDHLPGFAAGKATSRWVLDGCFMGMPGWTNTPAQSINYVSCHDNNTLIDRIAISMPHISREKLIKINNLAAAFSILSQGVPFFHAGEELLRTKPGKDGGFVENSYKSPDQVNAIRWDMLDQEEYRINRDYYRGLIAFRKAHKGLRHDNAEDVRAAVRPMGADNGHFAAYMVDEDDGRILCIFNAAEHAVSLTLPEGKWHICVRDNIADEKSFADVGGSITVSPISTMVLTQKKADMPVDVVAALIWEKDKFMICQRPATKARGLLWEFVGGKVETGESLQNALVRECKEELAISVTVGERFMSVIHEYPDILIRLSLFHCTIPEGIPQALEHNDIRWIHPSEIDNYQFCPADTDILARIKAVYGNKKPL